jgi:hypothetical protein
MVGAVWTTLPIITPGDRSRVGSVPCNLLQPAGHCILNASACRRLWRGMRERSVTSSAAGAFNTAPVIPEPPISTHSFASDKP